MSPPRGDLARSTLAVFGLVGLALATFWVLRPFLGPTIWAATIVVATWPMMRGLQARLWGRRSLATLVMTLALLALVVVPLTLAVVTVVAHVDDIVAFTGQMSTMRLPPPPDWLATLPLVGARISAAWESAQAVGAEGLMARVEPYVGPVIRWFAAELGSVGVLVVQSLMVVALAALMYAQGEVAASALKKFGRRLIGPPGEAIVVLSAQAIRGVALGVGVTAIVQSLVGGIGLAIAGVPYAAVLTVVMFLFALAQLGPFPVLLPAVAWMFWSDQIGWGVLLLALSVVAGTLDNVLRPLLIRRGADLPLLLIFAGVVGGMLAFGLVGIFIGPVVLAVVYTLLRAWMNEGEPSEA